MRRSLIALLLVPLLMGATVNGSFGVAGTFIFKTQAVSDSFVTLAESTFGTGATGRNNIIDWVPAIKPLRTVPLDTSGWTRNTSVTTCSTTDNTTINSIVSLWGSVADETVIVMPDCDVLVFTDDSTPGEQQTGAVAFTARDFVELEFQANSRLVMREASPLFVETSGTYTRNAPDNTMIRIGSEGAPKTEIMACDWTAGFAKGSNVLTVDSACGMETSGGTPGPWGKGDLIYVETDRLPTTLPASPNHRVAYRILCVDGNTTGQSGDAEDCAGLTDNQIRIDQALGMDYTPATGHAGGTITGHTIRQMERVGSARGGTGTETNNMAEFYGFKNPRVYRPNGYLYNSGSYAFNLNEGADVWFTNGDLDRWSYSWIGIQRDMSRVKIEGTRYRGMAMRARCVGEIQSLADNGSGIVRVTAARHASDGDCQTGDWSNDGTEPMVYFSSTAASPLADKFFAKDYVSAGANDVVFDLPGLAYNAGTMADDEVGLVSVINNWNVGATFVNGPANNVHFINEYYDGTRIGPLYQGGANYIAIMYPWMEHAANEQCSRSSFNHGNSGGIGPIVEGARYDCRMVPYATARTYSGDATPDFTMQTYFKIRLVDSGDGDGFPGNGGDALPNARGYIDHNEQSNLDGGMNYRMLMLSVLSDDLASADIDNADPTGGTGVASPYFVYEGTFLRNRCTTCDWSTRIDGSNPTTHAPDVSGSDDTGLGIPSAWNSDVLPTSFYYEATDMVNGKLPFWCDEATAESGEIGAHYDDMNLTETVLPAKQRWVGTCTLPSGADDTQ